MAGRLAQSLHQRVYVELDKTEDSTQVVPPWSLDVKLGNASSQRCPEGTHIVDIFDRAEIGGRLLVLGAPGSGKTTMLLQLAEELVKRGQENAAYPVPVLLNLSAWKSEFRDIPSWMVSDLKLKYGVRKDITEKWIEEGRILPLLDGLDELMSQRQETCVQALNEFLPTWSGTPLVVCSRLEEYQLYETKLGLSGAVILQPLTDRQIETYLRRAKCDWLWDAVRDNADVMDADAGLARSPLLLTLLVLSSDNLPVELWTQQESITERRRILFEAYIEARLQRPYRGGANLPATKQGRKPYEQDAKTKYWLGWLASQFVWMYKTDFWIEAIQPYFLDLKPQRFAYGLLSTLFICLFLGGLSWTIEGNIFGGLTGICLGLLYVYFVKLFDEFGYINTTNMVEFSLLVNFDKSKKRLLFFTLKGVTYSFGIGYIFSYIFGFLPFFYVVFQSIFVFLMGVAYFFMTKINTKKHDNQGVRQAILNSCIFSIIFLLISILVSLNTNDKNNYTEFFTIIYQGIFLSILYGAFAGGLLSVIQHLALRITFWIFGYSPWNYSKFLHYCTEQGFLQRVGGGYRFVHALLREHFAKEYGDLE
ncbi:NACHT domain-containing protein [Geitlerinema sp. CS-897]|nr:NACHT domain-containing protein [Geitlerinema sp. CS-897]